MTNSRPHLTCPECGKKGVTLRHDPRYSDSWACKYCPDFDATTDADEDPDAIESLISANPEHADYIRSETTFY